MQDRVSRYIHRGRNSVEGWLRVESADVVRAVDAAQRRLGIFGSVAEIGVHHGKLFILLSLLRRPGEEALAIDIFDAQHLNIDNSGHGDFDMFQKNMVENEVDVASVTTISSSSTTLTPTDVLEAVGRIRMFSVDGGHTSEIALNDIRLADSTLAAGGVLILDDAFNPAFPGVSQAVADYLAAGGQLAPFLVSKDKSLFCDKEQHVAFLREMTLEFADKRTRHERWYGHDVLLLLDYPDLRTRLQLGLASTEIYARIRHVSLVKRAVPIMKRILRPPT